MLVYGTVTVTITSTVPCPTTAQAPVLVTTTQYTTECAECHPVTTCYACEPAYTTTTPITTITPTPQQHPVTTITSGTVVYIVYGSTPAAVGQVTTNGVVQVISASSTRRDADLMNTGMAMALAVLALVVM